MVTNEIVKLQDGKHHYTFAASSGRWTSPTDESLTVEKREFFTSHLEPGRVWERIREELKPHVIPDYAIEAGTDHVEHSSFFVTAPRRQLDAIETVLQNIDTVENARAWNAARKVPTVYVTRSFQFQHVSPLQLLPHVDDALKAAKTTRYMVNSRELGVTASIDGMQQLEEVFRRLDTPENAKQWKPASPHELRALLAEHSLRSGSHMPNLDAQNPTLPAASSGPSRDLNNPSGSVSRIVPDNKPSLPTTPEQQSLALAKKLRDTESVTDEQRAELTQLVEQSLEDRLKQQAEQMKQLRAKLQQVEKALQERQQLKDRMILRRVEELLDPNIDWDSVARERSSTNPFSAASSTGTPIGLPGPPSLPAVSQEAAHLKPPANDDTSDFQLPVSR